MLKVWLRLRALQVIGAILRLQPTRRVPRAVGPRSIMVIRPDHLGDVLLSRPAIDRLVQAFPKARVVVAVGPWGRASLGMHAGFDVISYDFPGFSRSAGTTIGPYRMLLAFAYRLRRTYHFDAALILRPDHWWGAWLAALAGIPIRIGYATPETKPFLSVALRQSPGKHVTLESLDLVDVLIARLGGNKQGSSAGEPELPSIARFPDDAAIMLLMRDAGIDKQPFIVLHPGSGSALKSWSSERFAQAGRELLASLPTRTRLVVTGSAAESTLTGELCAQLPPGTLNLAGKLTWGMLETLLQRASLVVGVDSGPMHLAVAARAPSVALFGPADPAQFGPWGPTSRHRVVAASLPCRPCRRLDVCRLEPGASGPPPCMRAIEVDEVVATSLAVCRQRGEQSEAVD